MNDDLISRKFAIDALGERPLVWEENDNEYELGQRKQYDYDRAAIETVPSAFRLVKMPRYIDADTLHYKRVLIETEKGYSSAVVVFAKEIDKKATADVPDRKVGKWLFDDGSIAVGILQDKNVHCSICGHSAPGKPFWECDLDLTNFCPNCGAKMIEPQESEE